MQAKTSIWSNNLNLTIILLSVPLKLEKENVRRFVFFALRCWMQDQDFTKAICCNNNCWKMLTPMCYSILLLFSKIVD